MPLTPTNFMAIASVGDAKDFIVSYLKENSFSRIGQSYGYDIHILGIVQHVKPYAIQASRENPTEAHEVNNRVDQIGSRLMDAAWALALAGHLRPGPSNPSGQVVTEGNGNGYSLTESGQQALADGTI
jgi:hypothetical protein